MPGGTEDPVARMTLGVYVRRPDGSTTVRRPSAPVEPAADSAVRAGASFPPCECPRCRTEDDEAERRRLHR